MSRRGSVARKNKDEAALAKSRHVRFPDDIVFEDNIKENDIPAVEDMLRRRSVDVDVNKIQGNGMTPIHEVCLDGNLVALKLLVRFGADVNKLDEDTWTPLHAACDQGHVDIVRFLLEHGADPDIRNDDSERPYDLVDPSDAELIALLLNSRCKDSEFISDNEEEDNCNGEHNDKLRKDIVKIDGR